MTDEQMGREIVVGSIRWVKIGAWWRRCRVLWIDPRCARYVRVAYKTRAGERHESTAHALSFGAPTWIPCRAYGNYYCGVSAPEA